MALDSDRERARMEEVARLCNYDMFHFDDFRKCAEKYQLQKQESMASLKDVCCGSFVDDEVNQMISVLTNDALECHLRIAAGQQLLTVFLKDRRFWSTLRDHKLLDALIAVLRLAMVRMEGDDDDTRRRRGFGSISVLDFESRKHSESEQASLVVVVLEIIKLRFECNVVLDANDLSADQCESVLRALLPSMFRSKMVIRYLFCCIASTMVFHSEFVLSQRHRLPKWVKKERECFAPKLMMVYAPDSSARPSVTGAAGKEHHKFPDLFHLWIPKFVAQSVSLLQPQHKIQRTP